MALQGKTKTRVGKTNPRVLLALSGGIDSAVSGVLLLRSGYEVQAVFMKNWSSTTGLIKNECPWIEDRRAAMKVAAHLGIPLRTIDFERQYKDMVMKYFFAEYAAGRTPNPDVMCNKEIKFGLLYDWAMRHGFDYLATGHYAQIKKFGPQLAEAALGLAIAKDKFKDQTYFIYNLKPEQLKHLLFPIGGMLKNRVRKLARQFGLPNADRKESMGLCFVGKIELEKFLQQEIPAVQGTIVNASGQVLGQHRGIHFYTIGQRHGLGVGGTGPYYVVGKDLPSNTLVVSSEQRDYKFLRRQIQTNFMHWIFKPIKFPFKCSGRFRHQQELLDLEIDEMRQQGAYKPTNPGRAGQFRQEVAMDAANREIYTIRFSEPQMAIAPGQSLVLYYKQFCIGGGIIL